MREMFSRTGSTKEAPQQVAMRRACAVVWKGLQATKQVYADLEYAMTGETKRFVPPSWTVSLL